MYQSSVGSAPLYLTELLSRQVPKRQWLISASLFDSDYSVPFNKRKTFSDISFGTVAPDLWNQLPIDIRQSQSLDVFKHKLKHISVASTHCFILILCFDKQYRFSTTGYCYNSGVLEIKTCSGWYFIYFSMYKSNEGSFSWTKLGVLHALMVHLQYRTVDLNKTSTIHTPENMLLVAYVHVHTCWYAVAGADINLCTTFLE